MPIYNGIAAPLGDSYLPYMTRTEQIDLLAELGYYIQAELGTKESEMEAVIQQAYIENRWFTPDNIKNALRAISESMLNRDALSAWAAQYPNEQEGHSNKIIGLVMAGNIPLVGFHDWLCVFMAGHKAKVKLSDKDKRLLPFLVNQMGRMVHESRSYTEFCDEGAPLRDFDAVIATGSNNTARYFEQYFGKYPHIIRRNRTSVAVLTGAESPEQLYALGRDIFTYFGLGCRNVTKLFVPHGYNFEPLLEALHEYRELVHHDKYKNNFDYNMTLFILNQVPFLNNGCVMLVEDTNLSARIASVNYSYYDEWHDLEADLDQQREAIQCIISTSKINGHTTYAPGLAQQPGLADYADGVDVMAWMQGLS
jgi:hypothetical protein